MILPAFDLSSVPSDLTQTETVWTVTDGEEFTVWIGQKPQVLATREEAEAVMGRLCWHPRRCAGPFRVEAVEATYTKYGTLLSVRRIQ